MKTNKNTNVNHLNTKKIPIENIAKAFRNPKPNEMSCKLSQYLPKRKQSNALPPTPHAHSAPSAPSAPSTLEKS